MVTETGKGLSILIATEVGQDWQTFACWYSFYKNLPLAKVVVSSLRNNEAPFQLFQWAKRLKVPLFYYEKLSDDRLIQMLAGAREGVERKLLGQEILVVPPSTLAIDVLSPKILNILHEQNLCRTGHDALFLRDANIADIINNIMLANEHSLSDVDVCVEAKDCQKVRSLVSCRKGCGKWIDTSKGCPFSSAAGLTSIDMTANENRIIELWKKMCSLYSAVM